MTLNKQKYTSTKTIRTPGAGTSCSNKRLAFIFCVLCSESSTEVGQQRDFQLYNASVPCRVLRVVIRQAQTTRNDVSSCNASNIFFKFYAGLDAKHLKLRITPQTLL